MVQTTKKRARASPLRLLFEAKITIIYGVVKRQVQVKSEIS